MYFLTFFTIIKTSKYEEYRFTKKKFLLSNKYSKFPQFWVDDDKFHSYLKEILLLIFLLKYFTIKNLSKFNNLSVNLTFSY